MPAPIKIRIGTDFSGTDAPVWALMATRAVKAGRAKVSHKWSCDNWPPALKFIQQNHSPKVLYDDIVGRDHGALPVVDIYVAGFPCQPFSGMGLKQGFDDKRMEAYNELVETLKHGRARSFIIENVRSLLYHKGGESMHRVLNDLRTAGYTVRWRVYLAEEFGLPQRRPRVYMVGIHNTIGKAPKMKRPQHTDRQPLSSFLEAVTGPRHARPSQFKRSVCCRSVRLAFRRLRKQKCGLKKKPGQSILIVKASPLGPRGKNTSGMSLCVVEWCDARHVC